MTPADLLGAVLLVALVAYALLAGADFGGGIWDLFASGPRREAQRRLIEHAIGPIWEANHVWLILAVVLLFSGFPAAFAAVSITLFAPLVLLLIGIVLRGAAFTFRTYDDRGDRVQRRWGAVFSGASVLAPLLLGVAVGALSSGTLRSGLGAAPRSGPLVPFSTFALSVGLFACALFAFLAATYLTVEAEGELREDFRRRAIAAGIAVFATAALSLALSARDAPRLFDGLTRHGWSVALHLATAAAAVGAFAALLARRPRLARLCAAAQVTLIVLGWGAAQYPYLVGPEVTLASASGPRSTQVALLVALAVGALTLFPSLYLLFRIFKGERPFSVVDRRPARRA
ncbi:cytochrome d ubiquinol oxidase subunit II [Anaeromyxobacter diazotrophicus]|uniref:Cytochrome D ubiquinol oxidase subunit II n=1 Tax=Anaeromyxobacter diazotrophicus TaxID=2590199 RepID=A0A7I9VRX4_9BACT|nr:cytochrome d ubiquinol oxidase subunit II [Anaeromyxobacter diazotrophicus]GEJ59186.1 cytochrome D ubiquinol oxidase subunit II [Anaeromyxobacter diazotrophicus]